MTWYPCEHPERENDPLIRWHDEDCRGCAIAAQATILRYAPDLADIERTILVRIAGRNMPA